MGSAAVWVIAVIPVLGGEGDGNQDGQGRHVARFDLRVQAALIERGGPSQHALRARFAGEGEAVAHRRALRLHIGELAAVEGDGSATVAMDGPLRYNPHRHAFFGRGTATIVDGDASHTRPVRLAARIRGHGRRARLVGRFVSIRRYHVESSDGSTDRRISVFRGRVRGPGVVQPAPEPDGD